MAGQFPTPAATRYGPPHQDPYASPYALPPRRPPRRTAGGVVAAVLGAVAAIAVLGVLAMTALSGGDGSNTAGTRTAAKVTKEAATGSKLYKTGALTPMRCRLPRIEPGSEDSMQGFMETLSRCLDVTWERQFDKADLGFDPPARIFWDEPGRSPCGTFPSPGAAAFYCPENNTMYVGLRHIVETSGGEPVSHYAVYARVIAHEYGHHVQERAGILAYGHQQMERGEVAGRNDTSRRIELQAQCFAGAFLGAERGTLPMTQAQYEAMIADVRGRGDDRQPVDKRDHGSGRNYAGWVEKGYRDRVLAVCNTWTVPSGEVG